MLTKTVIAVVTGLVFISASYADNSLDAQTQNNEPQGKTYQHREQVQNKHQYQHRVYDVEKWGDRVDYRLDRKGDRINDRLDNRADRANEAGRDQLAKHLDRKGNRIERRLDHRGDRINRRTDRISQRRK